MRTKLRKINNIRSKFSGTFVRYGKKTFGVHETTTLLFHHITALDTGHFMADHIWFNMTVGFEALGELKPGDVIKFEARVKRYVKGYKGYRDDVEDRPIEVDYKLSFPTKVSRANPEPATEDMPMLPGLDPGLT